MNYEDFNKNAFFLKIHPTLSRVMGISDALVFSYIRYWVEFNIEKNINKFDGKYWTRLTLDKIVDDIMFLSKSSVRRSIKALTDLDFIETKKFKTNGKVDNSHWYTINFDVFERTMCSKWTPPSVQNEHNHVFKMDTTIKESNKESNKDSNIYNILSSFQENIDHAYENDDVYNNLDNITSLPF